MGKNKIDKKIIKKDLINIHWVNILNLFLSICIRRRDDVDDFLDCVSSHQSKPTKTSLYRSLKRPSIHQNTQRNSYSTQVEYFKDYEVTAYKYENSFKEEVCSGWLDVYLCNNSKFYYFILCIFYVKHFRILII